MALANTPAAINPACHKRAKDTRPLGTVTLIGNLQAKKFTLRLSLGAMSA